MKYISFPAVLESHYLTACHAYFDEINNFAVGQLIQPLQQIPKTASFYAFLGTENTLAFATFPKLSDYFFPFILDCHCNHLPALA
jgi:hypothetical protein